MAPRRRHRLRAALPVAAVAWSLGLAGCASDPPTVAPAGVDMVEVPTPSPDPGDFVARVDNPWLPLLPGAEWVYRTTDGERATVRVTDGTREVAGVATTVVHDVVTDRRGEVVEESWEWYAQDRAGNVWRFGERAVEDRDGAARGPASWEAGVDGAEAGIAMLARPRRGDGYPQEHAPGVAEDRATVLSLEESLQLPSGHYRDLLLLEESSPLEPGVLEHEYYAPGTGLVLAETVSGGRGRSELVGFTAGAAAR